MSSTVASRRAALVVGVVVLSVLAGWLLVSLLSGDGPSTAGGGSGNEAAAAPGSASPGSGVAGDHDGARKPRSGAPGKDARSGGGSADGSSASSPPGGGAVVEHRPADSTQTAAPQPGEKGFRLPGLRGGTPPAHLIDQAPQSDRAEGDVVAGYPVAYLRVPERAEVDATEVTSQGTRVQAVLEATCDCSVTDVLAFHDRTLAKLGLTGKPAKAIGGATARSYRDRDDSITLTVRRDGRTTTYTLFSVLTAARA